MKDDDKEMAVSLSNRILENIRKETDIRKKNIAKARKSPKSWRRDFEKSKSLRDHDDV